MEQKDASFWLEDHLTERAFTRLRPELLALEKDDLLKVNLDVSVMAVGILTRMPKLRSLPTELARKYPECSPQQFDKLEEYARCLLHAHALCSNMGRGTDTPPRLLKKARDLRSVLTTESRVLAARDLLDPKVLDQLDQGVGFLQVANDLHLLAKVLRTAWPQIQHKCAMPPRDLDNAEKLALRLLRELDRRDEATANVARAAEMRQRAFTLTFRTYDRIRAAVVYLRYDYRDANDFVPSLFPKHGRRGKAEEKSAAAE